MKFLVVALAFVGLTHGAALPHVSQSLLDKFQTTPKQDIMILMKGQTKTVVDRVQRRVFANTNARAWTLYDELHAFTSASQQGVLSFLANYKSASPLEYKGFYITNRISVRNANVDLVRSLAGREDIEEIREAKLIHLEDTVEIAEGEHDDPSIQFEWGVGRIGSVAAWDAGYTGAGIVVSHIDTGLRYTHQDLRANYREDHGWYDPYAFTEMPNDQNGHGSHAMGTICGKNGTGVAPDAKFITCKGCATSSCTEEALLGCAEFTLCPTRYDGSDPNCDLRPALSSNSWGGGNEDPWYDDVIRSWLAAEITPIFAIGNSGPGCRTANSPGDSALDVISVGATNNIDDVASFSSHGPTTTTLRIKPEVSAPGQNIRSCGYNADTWYATLPRTSMACPHVAGAVALLKQNGLKTHDELMAALTLAPYRREGLNIICTGGGVDPDFPWPNNSYGWERIRADIALGIAQ